MERQQVSHPVVTVVPGYASAVGGRICFNRSGNQGADKRLTFGRGAVRVLILACPGREHALDQWSKRSSRECLFFSYRPSPIK